MTGFREYSSSQVMKSTNLWFRGQLAALGDLVGRGVGHGCVLHMRSALPLQPLPPPPGVHSRFCVPPPHGFEHSPYAPHLPSFGHACSLQSRLALPLQYLPAPACPLQARVCVPPSHAFEHGPYAPQAPSAHATLPVLPPVQTPHLSVAADPPQTPEQSLTFFDSHLQSQPVGPGLPQPQPALYAVEPHLLSQPDGPGLPQPQPTLRLVPPHLPAQSRTHADRPVLPPVQVPQGSRRADPPQTPLQSLTHGACVCG